MNSSFTTRKIAINTIFQLFGKVVSMGITVLITIVVARYFGRTAYGEFSLMQNWPALFFIIVDFGFNAVAVKEIGQNWKIAGTYFATILGMRVVFSAVLIVLLAAVIWLFPYSNYLKIGIVLSLFLILTQGLYATGNIIFQSKLRYDLSTYAYLAGYALILVLTFLCVKYNMGVIPVSLSYVAGGLVTFAFMAIFIRRNYPELQYCIDPAIAGSLISKSLPLGLMFLFSQISFKSDSILLSVLPLPSSLPFDNNDSVAIYSLPYKIFEVALVVPTFFMNSMYPVFISKLNEGSSTMSKVFRKTLMVLGMSAVIASVTGYFLAPVAINILGGAEFNASITVLRILLFGLILYFMTQPLSWMLVTLGNQKILPGIYLISASINVLLNFFFIPKYSFLASSVITHISEFTILLLLLVALRKTWKSKYA